MTYYEAYSACQNEEEIKEMAIRDSKVAISFGNNPDRIKAIEDAMNKAITDKAESEDKELDMGTIRNEMTIVHCWKKDELEKVREDAIKFFNGVANGDLCARINAADLMIGPIMQSCINQEYTFVINGDCSKIGWGISERFHEARMKWCEKHKYDVQNIIVINFGEGDEPCRIVFDSQSESEGKE